MQHALDLVRPFWPLILALVVWPLVGAALSWWLWWDTPEHWEAYAKAHPGRALAIRALRTVSPHLRKLVVAWRDYASARSSLPPLGIALPAEKTGALVVSETRPVAHPTPADGVAFDAQRVALGAVTVDPAKGDAPSFDPHARQTVVPPQRDDGQRGSVDVRGLVTCIVGLILAGALLSGCPNWNRPACTTPGAYSCVSDQPRWCSTTGELTPIGDEPCAAQGRVCALTDAGVARCARLSDGGAE